MASLAMALFLTNLEIPIVTTSLVAITNDFGRFDSVGWVISSYLFGYVGFLVIIAKLSDIFGRKLMLFLSLFIFIIFSAACGASQSLDQLIILRSFQGIRGAGCFAVACAMLTELVPSSMLAAYTAKLSLVYAISLLIGPIIGGAISSDSTWRWAFLLNIPAGVPFLACLFFAIPANFPYHGQHDRPRRTLKTLFGKQNWAKVDSTGVTLLLLATLALTIGFEEAGGQFRWKSGYVISLLTISGILWICLFLWERYVTNHSGGMEPNRAMIGLMLNSAFLDGPWFVSIFQLPQKFQVVHGSSDLRAGIQTMPFTFAAPLGSIFGSILAGKLKVPAVLVIMVSGAFQTIGFVLIASLSQSSYVSAREYGFQIIAGFGCGINITMLILAVPVIVEFRDKAVGMGAISQLRPMGGVIVLAIATSVFKSYTRPRLAEFFASNSSSGSLIFTADSISQFDAQDQDRIRDILAHGYDLQMYVVCAFAPAQIPMALLVWRKEQVRV
ncbi:MFS general substrate transporter [Corynespora cassiicola Philippines]|uniref:MFS general substrate transporter n=1 Tax=Corynespora cassiicola Philippines TaxID=1448308 RepID=A0A2T2NWI9_CORCC|nr:MFS general substrate transporter [Corynespora cassiicola Philippines]